MSSGFMEHRVMLCLDKELYRAFIRLQADKDLGRSYAGLLPYVEGLYRMGYITKDVYEAHVKRYSEPLVKDTADPETAGQIARKNELKQKDKLFLAMIEQFEIHAENVKWFSRCRIAAEPFKQELESARKLLGLIDKATVQSKGTVQS